MSALIAGAGTLELTRATPMAVQITGSRSLPEIIFLQFSTPDYHVMHFVRTISKTQMP